MSIGAQLAAIRSFNKQTLQVANEDGMIRGERVRISKGFASYEIDDGEDRTEYHDDTEEVEAKLDVLAELVSASERMVAYTGAGISTAAGIPDFRGPDGVWTRRAAGKKAVRGVGVGDAEPTYAHYALAQMEAVRFVVTTNGDGLHFKAGQASERLAELHGAADAVRCSACAARWRIGQAYGRLPRKCVACGVRGAVCRTGVAFGSELPADEYGRALEASMATDLALVLGTSMRVAPAANLPEWSYRNGGALVIVNLQKTPYDKYAALVIRAPIDTVMAGLADRLGIVVDQPAPS